MADNVVNFDRQREIHELKRKEAKVDALRRAFRLARGNAESDKPGKGNSGKNSKRRKKRSGNSKK